MDDAKPSNKLTEEERAHIRLLLRDGKTPKDIASEIGRSVNAVRKFVRDSAAAFDWTPQTPRYEYKEKERKDLINLTFDRYQMLLSKCVDEFKFKALVEAFKTLCEAQRLEEGIAGTAVIDKTYNLNINVIGGNSEEEDVPELVDGEVLTRGPAPEPRIEDEDEHAVETQDDPLASL